MRCGFVRIARPSRRRCRVWAVRACLKAIGNDDSDQNSRVAYAGHRSHRVRDANKAHIDLFNFNGVGIIVACPSGVMYSNQAGGYACRHPELEGAFLPLTADMADGRAVLDQHFFYGKWKGHCYRGIDEETAQFLDDFLASSQVSRGITVDRHRLAESMEAWVYVRLARHAAEEALSGFDQAAGVLTWKNSD